eukprot:752908-Hanusia_phi.AAC.1
MSRLRGGASKTWISYNPGAPQMMNVLSFSQTAMKSRMLYPLLDSNSLRLVGSEFAVCMFQATSISTFQDRAVWSKKVRKLEISEELTSPWRPAHHDNVSNGANRGRKWRWKTRGGEGGRAKQKSSSSCKEEEVELQLVVVVVKHIGREGRRNL